MKPQQGPWPGNMAFYIEVDDLDSYADRIKDAGGKIVVDKMEVPSVGTLSLFEALTAASSGCGSDHQPRLNV